MADIAGKQFRAEQLRNQLAVLKVEHTVDTHEADEAAKSVKLDDEIAMLEKQVAIEEQRKASGGSVTEAMDIMAEAARLEEEQAASLEAATSSAVVLVPAEDGVETTNTSETETSGDPEGDTEETVEDHSQDVPAVPANGMGLVTPVVTNGGEN